MKKGNRWVRWGARFLVAFLAIGVLTCVGLSRAASQADLNSTDLSKSAQAVQTLAKPVKTAVVRTGCLSCTTSYPGMTKAVETAKLAFRVGGPVIDVPVKPGDYVKKGAVLFQIDPRDFQNQVSGTKATLDAARAKLAAMEKGARDEDVRALEANLLAARAKQNFAHKQLGRFQNLIKENAVSRSQFDSIGSECQAADSAVRAMEQELVKAKTGSRVEVIEAMKAEIRGLETRLKVAQDALHDTTLRAPFNGVITRQFIEPHEFIDKGKPVIAMHNIDRMEIAVYLPDQELVHRDINKPFQAAVTFHALGDQEFIASFKEVNTEANPQTRTYEVVFVLDVPKGVNLLPGMSAEVSLDSARAGLDANTPLVPATAVFSDASNKEFVWVVDPSTSTAIKREIQKGRLARGDWYEVIAGLSPGERVVTAGADFLISGMKLRPITR